MSYNMNCSYGLSARLPSFFDWKYFSCGHMCFNRNVVDVCEEDSLKDSLLIETVQEKMQQKLITPLLETAISISSLGERIINVLENSHLEDAVSFTKHKNVQGRKKMKRRKKRKQRTKRDVIKEDEIHAHNNFTLFENEYLLKNVPQWDNYVPKYSQRYYDNTSFSHITSEKESAYSEDKLSNSIVVRKRKKLQRRKKRKQKPRNYLLNKGGNSLNYLRSEDFFTNIPCLDSSVSVKDNLEGNSDDDKIFNQITSAKEFVRRCSQPKDMLNNPVQPTSDESSDKDTIFHLRNKNSDFRCEELPRTSIEQDYISNKIIDEDTKIVGAVTTIIGGDMKMIDTHKTNIGGDTNMIDEDMKIIDPNTTIIVNDTKITGGNTFSGKVVDGETFSKEQRRQLRRKMRNVKKRPESYVVLGLI